VLDIVPHLFHIAQDTQTGFALAKIVVQTDIADGMEVAEQKGAFLIGSYTVVVAVFRQWLPIVQDDSHNIASYLFFIIA
jgi:hypothetical protein